MKEVYVVMTFDEELLADLDEWLRSGDVVVESSSDEYFGKLASLFPTCGSKIDWREVPDSVFGVAENESYVDDCIRFFDDVRQEYSLNGMCVIIGDSSVEFALFMSIEVLRACMDKILAIPQHHYIIAKDFSWCISFTMEGDMAFGVPPA